MFSLESNSAAQNNIPPHFFTCEMEPYFCKFYMISTMSKMEKKIDKWQISQTNIAPPMNFEIRGHFPN